MCYAAAFVGNSLLLDQTFYRWTMVGQGVFIAVAAAGFAVPAIRRVIPVMAVPYAICFLTWATVVGFVWFATGRQRVTWERAPAVPFGDGAAGS